MNNIYPQIDYQQPLQQFYYNTFNSIATYEIEKNMRQTIEQDMLREYDFILQEAHWLLHEIYKYQFNSFNKDTKNVYLTLNGNQLTNPIENLEPIERELAHVLSREVHIVIDTKSLVSKRRENPQKIYLPLFLIRSKIEPTLVFDPYDQVKDGLFYFNLFTYTMYLSQRFNSSEYNPYDFSQNRTDFITQFLSTITINRNSEYIKEWVTYFFKTLRRIRNNLVLIGNRDVSEEIFYNGIIQQIFGHEHCLTITDDLLENWSFGSIVQNKLFIHIKHIPEKEEHQKKLKELLESIIVHDVIKDSNGDIPFLCQIIITLDQPHPFLNDFLSHSKVFFIDSLESINQNLNQPDRISLLNKISKNLENFSQQLASVDYSRVKLYSTKYKYIDLTHHEVINERTIHHSNQITINDTVKFNEKEYKTDNELFKNWLKNPELLKFALSFNSQNPILDPFTDSFEKILPVEDRYKHTYITGSTGSGKSELLKSLIYQDIRREDSSVILLDIHGDLAHDIARLVEDKERLIFIDPTLEKDHSPTINLFHTEDKSEENVEQISQLISSIINEINTGDSPSGSMIDILDNSIPLLVRSDNKDFYDLKRLMKDIPKVSGTKEEKADIQWQRKTIMSEINKLRKNEFEEEYFEDEFMQVNNSTRQAVRRRLNKILKDSKFSNLTNGDNTINLAKEMNSKGKIIIFHIPKSKMLNTYSYYVKFIIGLIQIIALKRADIKDEKKRPHTHLYIDEFHNFITPTIEEILTESRKYKLFLTFAHQSVAQIKDANLKDIILANTNVKIVGKNNNKTLEVMNKTLKSNLEDLEKLTAGEFYIQSGTNDVIKIRNTDKLLDGRESISDEQWNEHKQYQLENYYRSTKKEDIVKSQIVQNKEENFEKMLDEFIHTIKKRDLSENSCLAKLEHLDLKRFKEIEEDFDYEKDDVKQPRIRQQELNTIFQLAFEQDDIIENRKFTEVFNKDDGFKKAQMMTRHEKYRTDKTQEKYYLIQI